jgi:hypothetical protein
MGSKRTCNKTLRQILEMEIVQINSQVFHQSAENGCQDIVEEPMPTQTKEEPTNSSGVGAVASPATFESSVPTNHIFGSCCQAMTDEDN